MDLKIIWNSIAILVIILIRDGAQHFIEHGAFFIC